MSAPKAKALGFLLQRPNLRQHVYHWRRGSCLHRREFPQAPLRYCTSTTCISRSVHRSSRQQYYTQRWHLCCRRIHNRDKHALGSTSLSVPEYHSCYIFVTSRDIRQECDTWPQLESSWASDDTSSLWSCVDTSLISLFSTAPICSQNRPLIPKLKH